jgi:transposase-like protein
MRPDDTGWQPPHCPNPNCKYHNGIHDQWPWRRHGFFRRRLPPFRIQRFTCRHCRRSFSTQTFSTTYWLKRPDVLAKLFMKAVGGMANRQIARDLDVSPTTVDRQLSRLGRHCLLFHRKQLETAPPPREIAIDGFESFEISQYFPFHFHVAVEPDTSFFLHFTDSELRRKGRMTEHQKRRRRQLEERYGRPSPRAVLNDVTELLATSLDRARNVRIRSDLHQDYPRAFRRLGCEVEHEVVSSKAHRDRNNLLWEINRTDRMIRHSQAGHARETLAWPKRRQRAAERLAIYVVWWNYGRRRWAKGRHKSPAELRGVSDRMFRVMDVMRDRLFVGRQTLSSRWKQYYDAEIRTRALAINRRHDLKYAY